MNSLPSTSRLNDGREIPRLGFGTYLIDPDDTERAVDFALQAGYRHVDTARYYRNEAGVGQAVRSSGLPRKDVWITSKLPISADTVDAVNRSIDTTTMALGTHVDLYLIHWPMPRRGQYPAVWQALQQAQADGRLRSIGVSNFQPAQLDRILANGGILPTVNQIEIHPHLANTDLVRRCTDRGIAVEAWSPLGAGAVLRDRFIGAIATELDRSPAQVILRWHLQHGHIVLPKSSNPKRIVANTALYDFTLSAEQMSRIDNLDQGEAGRAGPHPERM